MSVQTVRKRPIRAGRIILAVILWFLAILTLLPFIDLFLSTFKDRLHLYEFFYWPDFTYTRNYAEAFTKTNIFASLGNSVLISGLTLLFNVIFGAMAGYMISRAKERFFKLIYVLFVAGLIVPTQTAMMIVYKMGASTHLINTIPFLIMIYVAGGAPFATLIYAGFTKNIPREIEESATIDGCGMYGTFSRIIFPLLLPATGTVIVTTVFGYWNDFIGPLIYLNGKTETIIMSIFKFSILKRSTDWGPVFALCFIASLPMIILFLFVQKHLLAGLVSGAIKG